jgi:uncharacterized protein
VRGNLLTEYLTPFPISQLLQLPNQAFNTEFDGYLAELPTLTPIQGSLQVTHHHNYLEVQGRAKTITTLSCYRCLSQYNHRLQMETTELIWLQARDNSAIDPLAEEETEWDDLVETLSPQADFDPSQWLYEQLCLTLPSKQLCDAGCQGIKPVEKNGGSQSPIDRRWSALERLRQPLDT